MLDKIKLLDVLDDKSWTSDGLPAIAAVKAITGDDTITRADINKVAFGLTRDNFDTWQPIVATPEVVETPVLQQQVTSEPQLDLDPLRQEIQALRDKSSELQASINSATLALHETDSKLKVLEAKLPEYSDPNHYALGYAAYIESIQANKAELIKQGLLEPAPIDLNRRRYNSVGRRFR